MNTAKERIAKLHASAASLKTDWPHDALDLTSFVFYIYTQANAICDDAMLVLAEAIHIRGGRVVLYDANACQRIHPLRTIPSVFVEHNGQLVAQLDVDKPDDVELLKWLAPDGPLSPIVMKATVADRAAKAEAARLAKEKEIADAEAAAAEVADVIQKDASLSPSAKALMGALLSLVPPKKLAQANAAMLDALKEKKPE
jgi:hypothetical protein